MISSFTLGVKVALTAIIGVLLGRNARTIPIDEYFLRKDSPSEKCSGLHR